MKILLVCTGNTCRSSMAEGIFNTLINDLDHKDKNFDIQSAGTWALEGSRASRNAIIVMKQRGIDISNQRSTPITNELVEEADIILTMTENHKKQILDILPKVGNKIFTLKEFVGHGNDDLDIIDPFGCPLDTYKECGDEIEKAIKTTIKKLIKN